MAVVALVPLLACSILVDTKDLSGGGDVDASPEGAVPPPPGSDGGTGGDAPIEAGSDGGADAACTFCDDFDKTALGATWTDKNETRGSLSFSNDAVTPPNALLAELTSANTGVAGDISLRRDIATTEKNVRCEVDMKISSALSSSGEIDLFEIYTYATDPTSYQVYIAHIDGVWQIGEFAQFADGGKIDRLQDLGITPNTGTWVHVAFTTNGTTAAIAFDDADAGALGGLTYFVGTKKHFGVGLTYVSRASPAGAAVLFDNVACYVAP